jgi:hypothetical protein
MRFALPGWKIKVIAKFLMLNNSGYCKCNNLAIMLNIEYVQFMAFIRGGCVSMLFILRQRLCNFSIAKSPPIPLRAQRCRRPDRKPPLRVEPFLRGVQKHQRAPES